MDVLCSALDNAADGALVVDGSQTIRYANEPAQRLLRFNIEMEKEQRCYHVLQGRDSERRLICKRNCSVVERCLSGEPIQNFDVQVDMSENGFQWFNVSVLHYMDRSDGQLYIVHLLREMHYREPERWGIEGIYPFKGKQGRKRPEADEKDAALRRFAELTERERQVLACLTQGKGTTELSEELSITVNTTRNHVQHILEKLGVHSRAEAVAYVHQHDLFNRWRQTRWW